MWNVIEMNRFVIAYGWEPQTNLIAFGNLVAINK